MSLKQLGRYQVIETLGCGAMGVVYKALDPLIERTVAIKTIGYAGLTPEEADDFKRRFFLEAKSAGQLNHPNIVTIHDVGNDEKLAYIAMEFLSGQSLRSVIDSGVVLPPRRIAEIAIAIADGLAFAHAAGIVHRDIKPANIMVLDSGLVKITDFGIALLPSGSLTMAGTALGSPKYMSPEQVLGKKADGRSDIFSLGAVLYELLTGRPPFAGEDLNAILYQVLNGAPPLPSTHNASLPPGFDRIVARALAKDPDKRYQSATEMASDLRRYRTLPGLMQNKDKMATEKAKENPATPATANITAPSAAKEPKRYLRFALAASLVAAILGGGYLWQKHSAVPEASSAPVSATSHTGQPAPEPKPATKKQAPAVAIAAGEKPSVALPPETTASENKPPVASTSANSSKAPVAAEKPAKKRPARTERLAEKDRARETAPSRDEPPPKPAEAPQPVAHTSNWLTSLNNAVNACQSEPFFSRVMCVEKARWKYCPGHWGSVAECPGSNRGS